MLISAFTLTGIGLMMSEYVSRSRLTMISARLTYDGGHSSRRYFQIPVVGFCLQPTSIPSKVPHSYHAM